jgi:hypothetical protein
LEGRALPLQDPPKLVIQSPEDSENKSTDPLAAASAAIIAVQPSGFAANPSTDKAAAENPDSDPDMNNNTDDEDEIPLMRLVERMKRRSLIAGGIMMNALNEADSEYAQELMRNPWDVELERVSETQEGFDREDCQEREVIVERGRLRLKLEEREWQRKARSRYRGKRESRGGHVKGEDERTSLRQVRTMRSPINLEASNIPARVDGSGTSSITSCPKVMGIQHTPQVPRPVQKSDCMMGNVQSKLQALHGQNCRRERSMMAIRRSNLASQQARYPADAYMTWVPYLPNCGPEDSLVTQSIRGGPWKAIRAHMESIPATPEPKLLDIREAIILDRERRMPWLYKGGNRPATEFPVDWGLKTYRC